MISKITKKKHFWKLIGQSYYFSNDNFKSYTEIIQNLPHAKTFQSFFKGIHYDINERIMGQLGTRIIEQVLNLDDLKCFFNNAEYQFSENYTELQLQNKIECCELLVFLGSLQICLDSFSMKQSDVLYFQQKITSALLEQISYVDLKKLINLIKQVNFFIDQKIQTFDSSLPKFQQQILKKLHKMSQQTSILQAFDLIQLFKIYITKQHNHQLFFEICDHIMRFAQKNQFKYTFELTKMIVSAYEIKQQKMSIDNFQKYQEITIFFLKRLIKQTEHSQQKQLNLLYSCAQKTLKALIHNQQQNHILQMFFALNQYGKIKKTIRQIKKSDQMQDQMLFKQLYKNADEDHIKTKSLHKV